MRRQEKNGNSRSLPVRLACLFAIFQMITKCFPKVRIVADPKPYHNPSPDQMAGVEGIPLQGCISEFIQTYGWEPLPSGTEQLLRDIFQTL